MQATRMLVSDISVGAFDPHCEVGRHEQVENPIDAIRCNPASFRLGNRFGNVISGGRAIETGQRLEHRLAHRGPLLTLVG